MVTLLVQQEVTLAGDTYRLDFLVEPAETGWYAPIRNIFPGVVIELDGHEFHDRTKEQVTYRNRRDRALQAAGWPVLHYSGSELYRSGRQLAHRAYLDAVQIMAERRRQLT